MFDYIYDYIYDYICDYICDYVYDYIYDYMYDYINDFIYDYIYTSPSACCHQWCTPAVYKWSGISSHDSGTLGWVQRLAGRNVAADSQSCRLGSMELGSHSVKYENFLVLTINISRYPNHVKRKVKYCISIIL